MPTLFFTLQKTAYDWQYTAKTKNGCKSYKSGCLWPRGKMLGGSGAMNAMIYLRSHRRDYDHWQELGNTEWGYENVLKYFKKSEQNTNDQIAQYHNGKYHNQNGLLKVGSYRSNHPMDSAIERCYIAAGAEAGYEYVDDFNSDTLLGYSRVQGTIYNGRRQSTAKAFLIPAKDRPNLHVIKNAQATKIHFDRNNLATSVDFTYNGEQMMNVKTKKEIIVSGGAISSPQLLLLSGVGPKKHLEQFNIDVKLDLAVGRNLQDHLIVPMFFSFDQSENPLSENILNDTMNLLMYNRGPYTAVGITDLVSFINTVNGSGFPDVETHHFEYAVQSPGLQLYLNAVGFGENIQAKLFEVNQKKPISMNFVVLLNPTSVGRIKLKSIDPMDKPEIFANYLDTANDWQTILNGVRYQYNQTNSKAFKKYSGSFIRVPLPKCDQLEYLSDAYFKCYIDAMTTTVYHPVGTAKMGPAKDKQAVVDSRLRVHGIKNLRVIDASIMPTIVSSNTNAPTIMIGEMGADLIKEDWNAARDEL